MKTPTFKPPSTGAKLPKGGRRGPVRPRLRTRVLSTKGASTYGGKPMPGRMAFGPDSSPGSPQQAFSDAGMFGAMPGEGEP